MVYKKIKKSGISLVGLILSMLLVIGIFTSMFLWLNANAENAGITVDSKYNDTYNNLSTIRDNVQDNVDSVSSNLQKVQEADNFAQVAWNGLKGVGATLLLPIEMIGHSTELAKVTLGSSDVIPSWFNTLLGIGIIVLVTFLIMAVLTGGNPRI